MSEACSRPCVGWSLIVALVLVGLPDRAGAQAKLSDQQEIEAAVLDYTRMEDAGDMQGQARLMAPDRWWHGPGGRRTDNALWMKVQATNIANSAKRYPGVTITREVRDLKIKMVAPTVAVASFTWFFNRSIPPDLPADKIQALGPTAVPMVSSQVWVKQADGWRMVSTHQSPEYVR